MQAKKTKQPNTPSDETVVTNTKHDSSASAHKGMLIASELIAGPITGSALGYLLEIPFPEIAPVGLIGGFILGTVAAFYSLIKQAAIWDKQIKLAKIRKIKHHISKDKF